MKQVDILSICPDTGKRIAIEVCHSTFNSEPDQAVRDLLEADAVVIVCANRYALTQLEDVFIRRLGRRIDPRITLAMPCHLAEAPSLSHVYECPVLVYDPKWDSATKVKKSRRCP